MRQFKRLVVVAAACAMALGMTPAHSATSATEMAVNGTLSISGTLPSTASATLGGQCARATVTATPAASASTCAMATSGRISGDCITWQGQLKGTVSPQSAVVGSSPSYAVTLTVTMAGESALTVFGVAQTPDGPKSVTGSGVAARITGSCSGPATYSWVGSLTLHG